MADIDTKVEFYKKQFRKLSEADLEEKKVRAYPYNPEWKAANALLIELKIGRHKEAVSVDRSARNIAWAGFGVAILALGVAVFALPQVHSLLPTQPKLQLPTNPVVSPPVVSLPVSPPSSSKVGNTKLPTTPTPAIQPTQPSADDLSKPPQTPLSQ